MQNPVSKLMNKSMKLKCKLTAQLETVQQKEREKQIYYPLVIHIEKDSFAVLLSFSLAYRTLHQAITKKC